jgi:hypothetical protein
MSERGSLPNISWQEGQITCYKMSRLVSRVYLREILESLQIYTCANWPFADPTYQLRCLIFSYRPFFGIHMEDLRQTQIK